jgi:hypothetical protein
MSLYSFLFLMFLVVFCDVHATDLLFEFHKSYFNSFPVIRGFAVRVTPISTNKKHAINTLKMAALLRSNVMQS